MLELELLSYPGEAVVAPELGPSHRPLCVLLSQDGLLTFPVENSTDVVRCGTWTNRLVMWGSSLILIKRPTLGLHSRSSHFTKVIKYLTQTVAGTRSVPLSPQLVLVHPQPGVGHLLAAAGHASPPAADALPAGEAAPADRLAPLLAPLGGGHGALSRHAAGELLQGGAQRHDRIHFQRSRSCSVNFCGISGDAFLHRITKPDDFLSL